MEPLQELYPRITSFANLHAAARRAQRAKRYRPAVLAFNARLEQELFALRDDLRAFTYQPKPFVRFEIFEPKRRVISAAAYRDRVVHHALCEVIMPPLERARTVAERELEALRLRLHPIKSQIRRTADGASFVGFHLRDGRVRVRQHTLRRGRRRLKAVAAAVDAGDLAPEHPSSPDPWQGIAAVEQEGSRSAPVIRPWLDPISAGVTAPLASLRGGGAFSIFNDQVFLLWPWPLR